MTARVSRGVRLLRWLTSLNRGMKATQRTTRGRGLRYVLVLTLLVNFAGAAGIYYFENPAALRESQLPGIEQGVGISSYGEALWWTAMMLTTMGSDYFPKTTEGRILALILAVYAFAIFGYITATVASLIIRVDQTNDQKPPQPTELAELKAELAELKTLLTRRLPDIPDTT
jgi:voltage-gated potassium channel